MYDVVIAGAGPVGLFLAGELRLAGCSVLVLERDPEPSSPWKAHPVGMRGLSATSTAAFHRRGLLDEVQAVQKGSGGPGIPEMDSAGSGQSAPRVAGHFAGMLLDGAKVDAGALPYWLPGPASDAALTSLEGLETVLARRAAGLGVEIVRGAAVTGLAQGEEAVTVRSGGREYAARWAVGCDGAHSAVRELAGFAFTGSEPLFTGYVALAAIDGPDELRPGFTLTPNGMYLRPPGNGYIGILDFDGGAYDRSRTPDRDHLQAVLRRVSGTGVTLGEVEFAASFTDRAMQATEYRRGRVLLAGDAAHIHAPLGGQGLNLGLSDAMNLGWKLAATVRGDAPYGLLGSYTAERHPIGAAVLDWTRAQASIMRPDPHSQAMQAVVRDLVGTGDVTTYMFRRFSGASIRHDVGCAHPLAGRGAPELRLADGTHLGELMRDGRGVALDLTPAGRLRGAAEGWAGRIRYAAGKAVDDLGLSAVLVRPDGIVAWASDGEPDEEEFARAAGRWFGAPGFPQA